MKKIRIALGSNDGETIISDHMGTARDFYIFDLLENGQVISVEKRDNTSPKESETDHGNAEKLRAATEIFADSDVVLGRRGSPNFVKMRDKTRFQPVVTRMDSIADSLQAMGDCFAEIHDLVERRRRGERPREIPIVQKTA